ncbi:MAG: YggS family pyridoxal phosphate-dependent enzyme [Actinobacteria bacterium]|nr:YggS family pyridoxal phosphate-dependent enzyme [Actinomycetota bacterium]
MEKSIKSNVDAVRGRIGAAALRAGREPGEVTLLAATKNRSAEQVLEAVDAGVTVFGENRVQELLGKMELVGREVDWHFIGHLQRNKVKSVVGVASLIHSVDTIRLAQEIDRRAEQEGKAQAVLLQVNVAGEESKFGIDPADLAGFIDELKGLRHVEVRGLSTIAPFVDDPEVVRRVFSDLRELGRDMDHAKENFTRSELSMGMTGDFEVAVEEGSTMVRVGTAIFDID